MSKNVSAIVHFLTTSEGGRLHAPKSGVRAELLVGDILTSCIVRKIDDREHEEFELGKEYLVSIELPFWEEYKHLLIENMDVELHEGSRIIGRGHLC